LESISVYKKKLRKADDRMTMANANRQFETNPGRFYRVLGEEEKRVSEDINIEETANFWSSLWKSREKETDHQNLIEAMQPCQLTPEYSEDKIRGRSND